LRADAHRVLVAFVDHDRQRKASVNAHPEVSVERDDPIEQAHL
jgi:hypothetical protein